MAVFNTDLALLLLVITFAVEIIGWIGNDAIVSVIYPIYTRFASSQDMKDKRELRAQVLQLRKELSATSAQDEFSKWAKLRRKLDKAIAELEQANASSASVKAAFSKYVKSAVWLTTTLGPMAVTSWHRRDAVFFLPPGWFGPATWWMGLPSAPMGAVACGVWTLACKRTFNVVKGVVVDLTHKEKPLTTKESVPVMAAPVEAVPSEAKVEHKEL